MIRRILVLKLDHLEGFIVGLPSLQQLRRAFPSDHITLVCAVVNRAAAAALAVADEILTFDYLPETALGWTGKPVTNLDRFRGVTTGRFDLAVDLRVDEDTRPLLKHVSAKVRCGIGTSVRHPYLDVTLPADLGRRYTHIINEHMDDRYLAPEVFSTLMPLRPPSYLDTGFKMNNSHLVWGPYVALPVGKFRATFLLQMIGLRMALKRVEITIDVVADYGSDVLAGRIVSADNLLGFPGERLGLEFYNESIERQYEFRVHAAGRPLRARMQFWGVRLQRLETIGTEHLWRPDLYTGEQLSLLVQLVSDRWVHKIGAPYKGVLPC